MTIIVRLPRTSLLVHKTKRAAKVRYRLLHRKPRAAGKQAVLRIRPLLLKLRNQVHLKGRGLLTFASKRIATDAGLLLAGFCNQLQIAPGAGSGTWSERVFTAWGLMKVHGPALSSRPPSVRQ